MFRAVKNLHRKTEKHLSVHDSEGKTIVSPNEVYQTITNYFSDHFHKSDTEPIFMRNKNEKLKIPITKAEVTSAVSGMTNNRAPGHDNISVELIKYAPEEIHEEISHILTEAVEQQIDIGANTGLLVPLENPESPCQVQPKIFVRSYC